MKLEIKEFTKTYIASEKKNDCQVSKGIQHLVSQHLRVIDFVEKVEGLFTYISLAQCLSSTLIICAMGYVVLTVNSSIFFLVLTTIDNVLHINYELLLSVPGIRSAKHNHFGKIFSVQLS